MADAAGSYQDIVKQLEVGIINTTAINLTARISLAGGGKSLHSGPSAMPD